MKAENTWCVEHKDGRREVRATLEEARAVARGWLCQPPIEETPHFKHDCTRCEFLGHAHGCDLYFCLEGVGPKLFPTVVARYGDDGPDYTSGLAFSSLDPRIGEARERAEARGLLPVVLSHAVGGETEVEIYGPPKGLVAITKESK